ncbi:MAG: MarR family transcriptional regulator [Marinomonas sp.]
MLLTVNQIRELSEKIDSGEFNFSSAQDMYGLNRDTISKYVNAYRENNLNSIMNNIDRLTLIKNEISGMKKSAIFRLFKERFGVTLTNGSFCYAAKRARIDYARNEVNDVLTEENREKAIKIIKSGEFTSLSKLAGRFCCSDIQIRNLAKELGITRIVSTREKTTKLLKSTEEFLSPDDIAAQLKITKQQAHNALHSLKKLKHLEFESMRVGRITYYKIK